MPPVCVTHHCMPGMLVKLCKVGHVFPLLTPASSIILLLYCSAVTTQCCIPGYACFWPCVPVAAILCVARLLRSDPLQATQTRQHKLQVAWISPEMCTMNDAELTVVCALHRLCGIWARIMHAGSGITEYSLRVLGLHAMLEVPVLAATVCIILAQCNGPFSYQLPQIISIVQTVIGLTFHALWLLYKRRTNPLSPAKGASVAPDPVQQENTSIVEVVSAK